MVVGTGVGVYGAGVDVDGAAVVGAGVTYGIVGVGVGVWCGCGYLTLVIYDREFTHTLTSVLNVFLEIVKIYLAL